jgi:hypothetical protein
MSGPNYHSWTHRPNLLGGTDPLQPFGFYEVKLFADRNALDGQLADELIVVSTGVNKFVIWIPEDLDGTSLVYAAAGVSVAGDVTVQVKNLTQGYNFLTTVITIDSAYFSYPVSGAAPVIANPHDPVETGDRIAFDVLTADGIAEGLGVMLAFGILHQRPP